MDIPSYKELQNNAIVDVRTSSGVVHLYPLRSTRGEGKNKWILLIEGMIAEPVKVMEQCYLEFNGYEIGANFMKCEKSGKTWAATLQTIVTFPEFWGDEPSRR